MFDVKMILNVALGVGLGIAVGKLVSGFVPTKAA